ncbi:hypothetical protein [Brevibacterium luteolum]|uniref:hypothetical protein n=1 Tax=Brevibacterium luteolum TaxID=199591 RepID=UPI00223C2DA8|nr:hypothetical protein [Brevibacterium luteolum]MCT1828796.1 hypothetical protein [Brevibacterium luteolum]
MSTIFAIFFLAFILACAGQAVWRVIRARRAVAAGGQDVPVSRMGLFVGIIAAVTVFIMQWLLVSLPSWALFVWVPAALAVVFAAFEAARLGPQLPWLRPGRARSDLVAAGGEAIFSVLVIAAVVASVVLALQ